MAIGLRNSAPFSNNQLLPMIAGALLTIASVKSRSASACRQGMG